MPASVLTQRLLQKRAKAIYVSPTRADLDRLASQLRSSFPEYRRQPKQEFLLRLETTLFSDDPTDSERVSGEDSESDAGGSEEGNDLIDEAVSDFIASEGTEKINRGLRDLYGLDTTSAVGPVHKSESKKSPASDRANPQPQKRHRQSAGSNKRLAREVGDTKAPRKKERRDGQKSDESDSPVPLPMSKSFMAIPKKLSYADLGGLEDVIGEIKELVEYPLKHPEVYSWLGVEPPRGILLHGPPGCGKTALANAIAHECQVPFFKVSAPEIISGMSGESEGKIRALFGEALSSVPSIVFIGTSPEWDAAQVWCVDEIDAIAAKRENAQREMERRIVAQMLTCMDDLGTHSQISPAQTNSVPDADLPPEAGTEMKSGGQKGHVIVLGATNRPDVLDPALRRAGRFDREIALGIPTEASRIRILSVMCAKLKLEGDFDFCQIARKTPGFVGADLEALTREAAAVAITRIFHDLQSGAHGMDLDQELSRFGAGPLSESELRHLNITMEDFVRALPKVQPSLGREGFTTKPDITWSDIGSLAEIREELSFSICQPILHPERFERMGLTLASGVLLFGPPGCGKTLVAKAVANEAGTNFISIKGPELLNKYVGESERAVRQLFARARAAKPCVLFFDEMDALAPKRGMDNNQAAERLVNQLLTEMDGMDGRDGVFLIAATNRPDIIDPALLRPGRLDKILYVPLPDAAGRGSILQTLARKSPVSIDVDFDRLGRDERCRGLSGADLAAVVREACILALKEGSGEGVEFRSEIDNRHFDLALDVVKPSVSETDAAAYAHMKSTLRKNRSRVKA